MKGIIPLVLVIFYFHMVYPQSQQQLSGMVLSEGSDLRLAKALVRNLRTHTLVRSSDRGEFSIVIKLGDTLTLEAEGHVSTSIMLSNFKDQVIRLKPVNTLAEVVVRASSPAQDRLEVQGSYRAQGIYFQGKPPLSLLSPFDGSPLTFLYELSSRDARNARRFSSFALREEERLEISKRFNDTIIRQLVPVSVQQLPEFKERFSPSLYQIRAWNDVELYEYIKAAYQEFARRP